LTGGEQIRSKGNFYKPTILKNVSPNMRVAQEVFGPVAPIIVADDEIEAVRVANNSQYGLGASIWTQDLDKAEKLSTMIRSGIVTVNNVVISDPRVPFGGVKKSGFGRELSRYGMLEFVNIKSVRFNDQLVHQHHVELCDKQNETLIEMNYSGLPHACMRGRSDDVTLLTGTYYL
jgi:acyl-CoA reductase-like NAD-dependent aldehyde dehydrogenase